MREKAGLRRWLWQVSLKPVMPWVCVWVQVIKMFALKQPAQLRERLAYLQREHKLGNVGLTPYTQQAVEILTALKKLKQTVRMRTAAPYAHPQMHRMPSTTTPTQGRHDGGLAA